MTSGTEGLWPGFSVGQTEYFAADEANELCRTVVETYQRLKDIQGEIVPEFYASVLYDPQLGFQYPLELSSFELIPGILVEYVDGFILADITRHAPRDSWQQIGSDACAAVNNFSRHDVLNWDTRLTNTIIKTNKDRNGTVEYKPFVIDLVCTRLREPGEIDEEWNRQKDQKMRRAQLVLCWKMD